MGILPVVILELFPEHRRIDAALSKNRTRQQKRQMLYAAIFFGALLIYQTLYIAGVKHILDLDIPTTVAIFILVFNLAAQRERFMRASLLELPIFQNSPYAIAIYNGEGQTEYSNALWSRDGTRNGVPDFRTVLDESAEVLSGSGRSSLTNMRWIPAGACLGGYPPI
jgi:hypothetical protein